jgi:hemolysin activation/secretion protein
MRGGIGGRTARMSVGVALALLALPWSAAAKTEDSGPIEGRLPKREQQEADPSKAPIEPSADQQTAVIAPFTLKSIDIRGATALTGDTLKDTVSQYLGKQISAFELAEIATAMTKAYRDRGFFLSRVIIPQQDIIDGTLKIEAIEGIVVSAKVNGLSDDDANTQFADLLAERPARLSTFERALLLLSDRYGYKVENTRLLPDENAPQEFRLELNATWKPVNLEIFLDNRGTERNGEDQSFIGTYWNSLIKPGDRISASLFTSPTNFRDSFYGEASYAAPWGGGNLWTEIGASSTIWNDPDATRPTQGNFEAQKLWARLSAPLLRTRETSLWVNMQLEARDSISDDGVSPTQRESLRTLRGSFSYSETGDASRMNATLQLSQGINALGASANGEPNLSRDDGRPQFTSLRLNYNLFTQFAENWFINLSASAQYADGPLPSSEEFYFGGARYGRGYDYSTLSGDQGWATAAELRYSLDGAILGINEFQLFVFADAGRTWTLRPEANDQLFASSAGGGVRLFLSRDLVASIEAALPLAYTDSIDTIDTTRIFVSLSWWH